MRIIIIYVLFTEKQSDTGNIFKYALCRLDTFIHIYSMHTHVYTWLLASKVCTSVHVLYLFSVSSISTSGKPNKFFPRSSLNRINEDISRLVLLFDKSDAPASCIPTLYRTNYSNYITENIGIYITSNNIIVSLSLRQTQIHSHIHKT